MKNIVQMILLAFTSLLVGLALTTWAPFQPTPVLAQAATPTPSAESSCDSKRSVQVSGAAVINVVPDRALLQLGVQSNGATPDEVQATNSKDVQRVISAVRALGVEAKDITTDYFLVRPVYDNYNSLFIKGYRIDNTVAITVRDITQVDKILIAALKAGANEVQNVEFYTSELRKYRDQARDLAMKAASEKAQALATAAGAQAGCILSIQENSSFQYFGSWRSGREAAVWAQNVMQNAAATPQSASAQSDEAPLVLGQIAVRAEISASYSLK